MRAARHDLRGMFAVSVSRDVAELVGVGTSDTTETEGPAPQSWQTTAAGGDTEGQLCCRGEYMRRCDLVTPVYAWVEIDFVLSSTSSSTW